MPTSHIYADLSSLRDNDWIFSLAHHQAIGYWIDPLTGQEHLTGTALRIQKNRIKEALIQEGRIK